MARLGKLRVDLEAGMSRLEKGFRVARFRAQRAGDQVAAGFSRAFGLNLRIPAIFGAGGLAFLTKQTIDTGDQIAKTADKLGVGIEELQRLRFAGERAGIGVGTLDMGLQRFTRRASEAAQGTGEAKAAFQELGITLVNSQGVMKPTEQLLKEVANAMGKLPSEADKLRVAFKLFDSEGVVFKNLLKDGSKGIEDLTSAFEKLGGGITEQQARDAEKVADALTDLKTAISGEFNRALLDNAETLEEWARGAAGAFDTFLEKAPMVQKALDDLPTNLFEQRGNVPGAVDSIVNGPDPRHQGQTLADKLQPFTPRSAQANIANYLRNTQPGADALRGQAAQINNAVGQPIINNYFNNNFESPEQAGRKYTAQQSLEPRSS